MLIVSELPPTFPPGDAPTPPAPARTDAAGRFTFELAPVIGDQWGVGVPFVHPFFLAFLARANGLVSSVVIAEPDSKDELLLRVDARPGRIVGSLRCSERLRAEASVTVGPGLAGKPVGADGRFEVRDLHPGDVLVLATGASFSLSKPVVVKPGEDTRVELSLEPSGVVDAVVKNLPEGASASIFVEWDGGMVHDPFSDSGDLRRHVEEAVARGELPAEALASLPEVAGAPSPLEVPAGAAVTRAHIHFPGSRAWVYLKKPIVVRAGATTKVEIEWPSKDALGVVKGKISPGIAIKLAGPDADVLLEPRENGSFEVALPPGRYAASARLRAASFVPDSEESKSIPVTIVKGKTVEVRDVPLSS